jgi:hypothetical protein
MRRDDADGPDGENAYQPEVPPARRHQMLASPRVESVKNLQSAPQAARPAFELDNKQ